MRTPSIAQSPASVSSARENARRISFTSALWRPSTRRSRSCAGLVRSGRGVRSAHGGRVWQHHTPFVRLATASPCYVSFRRLNWKNWGNAVLAEIIKIHHDSPEASLVKYAAEQIRAGQVLGMPTDTFYGLAADPLNLRAVERVYEIKSRSRHKPLSLLIESVDQAEDLARPLPERVL